MAAITAGLVKELRDKTGAGMMDCKTALAESNGEMEAAIDWLRAKGLSKAAKKADRVAAEGLIGVASAAKAGAVVEVNSETDFVARNAEFQKAVAEIAKLALKAGGDIEKLAAMEYPKKKDIGERLSEGACRNHRREYHAAPDRGLEGQGRRGCDLRSQSGHARHGKDRCACGSRIRRG